MRKVSYLLSGLIVIAASSASAQSAWTVRDGHVLPAACVDGAECTALATPCEATSVAAAGDQLFVACSDGGIAVYDTATEPPQPLEVRRLLEPVRATAVRVVDGRVWVETPLGSRPLERFEGPPPVLQPPRIDVVEAPQAEEPRDEAPVEVPRVGSVIELGTGWVIVDLGSTAGLGEGAWVEFLEVETVDLGGGQSVEKERRVGLGTVDTLNSNRARVELALNDRIELGARVRAHPDGVTSTKALLTPQRPRGTWSVGVNTRPFLALSTLGGGAIMDATVGYRFDVPFAVDLVFAPFAFGLANDGNILTFAGNLIASYDTTAFQIGLGAGASKINTLSARDGDFIPGTDAEEPSFRAGFSAAQFVRLGSVDGLHIAVLNNFILFEDEFVFGGITVDGAVPIKVFKDPAWIVAKGGGGVPGHLFGELGIRILARGNGGPGSVFLTPTVGAGLLSGEAWESCESYIYDKVLQPGEVPTPEPGLCRVEYDYGGPLIGFGVEWRN